MNQNIDPKEAEKFNQLANTWWDKEGEFKTLHALNPLRLNFIESKLNLFGKNILDVGCGGGILSESLAKQGAKVTGLDIANDIIEVATKHARSENLSIQYVQETVEDFANKHSGEFDVITCMEMLEHVPCPVSVINACEKLLKPEGHLFLSTINRNPKAYLFAVVGAEYLLKILPKGTHDYAKFIRPAELSQWLRDKNMQVNDTLGIHYNPFTQQFKTSTDISVSYLLYAKKE